MKKRVIGFIAAVVLALIGTTLLVAFVKGAEDRALAGETIVEVYVANTKIEQGTAGEDLVDKVSLEKIPPKVPVEGAVGDLEDIDGLVAEVDLLPGEQITFDRFVERSSISRYARTVQAPNGLLEMTMSLSPERVGGGSIRPGDRVAIVASFEPFDIETAVLPEGLDISVTSDQLDTLLEAFFKNDDLVGDATPNSTHILEHKVLVTHVQEEELPQETFDSAGEVVGSGAIAPTGNLLVTVAVDAPTIERIVFTKEFGLIWLAAEPSDASEAGTRLVDRGNIYDEGSNA
jgi:pilus assembly protein CpaB